MTAIQRPKNLKQPDQQQEGGRDHRTEQAPELLKT
jgi:hypothetical protein